MLKYFVVILFSIAYISGYSQTPLYTNYTTFDGLPSNEIYHVHQDSKGYMWFATDRGISRFNGYEFENFTTEDGLTCNTVFKFYPQKNGDIWCSTFNNKLFYFNPDSLNFTPYKFNSVLENAAGEEIVDEFILLDNGTIYLSYISNLGALIIGPSGDLISESKRSKFSNNNYTLNLSSVENQTLGFLSESRYVVPKELDDITDSQKVIDPSYSKYFHNDSINIFSGENEVYFKKNGKVIKEIQDYKVIGVGQFDENHFWVGLLNGGLHVYDFLGQKTDQYLLNESVAYFTKDREGVIWFSTLTSGIFYSQNLSIKSYEEASEYMYKIGVNDSDELFLNQFDGLILKKRNRKFIPIAKSTDNKYTPVSVNDNLYNFNWTSENDFEYSSYLFRVRGGNYSLNNSSVLNRERSMKKYRATSNSINDAIEYRDGILLSSNIGLQYFDTLKDKIVDLNLFNFEKRIEDIERVGDQYLLASMGSGMIVMEDDSLYNISKKDGLSNSFINEIYVDNDSLIWLSTSNGINVLKLQNSEYTIEINDLLLGLNVTDIEVVEDTVWVATRKGLFSFYKSEILNFKDDEELNLFITKIKINDETYNHSNLFELSHDENKFSVTYESISFKSNKNILYRYKIHDLEDAWNVTTDLSLTYVELPPGEHELEIQVSRKGQNWSSNNILITIYITPPFYDTWWFYILLLLSLVVFVYLFFKIRVLTYNKDVTRELLRLIIRKLKKNEKYLVIREKGKDVKIKTSSILYVKAQGNYLDIHTLEKTITIRCKIGEFLKLTPDPIEYIRIHRSCIVRIDQIDSKSINTIVINNEEFIVTETYLKELKKIQF